MASWLVKSLPARRPAKVTARYMAPVSRNSKPRRRASALAALLLPAPAGPSIVTIMESSLGKRKRSKVKCQTTLNL